MVRKTRVVPTSQACKMVEVLTEIRVFGCRGYHVGLCFIKFEFSETVSIEWEMVLCIFVYILHNQI